MTERAILVCDRVVTLPAADVIAGSRQVPCGDCAAAIWVSVESRRAVGADALVLCLPCAEARARALGQVVTVLPPTRGQLGEIVGHWRRN